MLPVGKSSKLTVTVPALDISPTLGALLVTVTGKPLVSVGLTSSAYSAVPPL
jgi:hypothetical protein